MTDPTLTDPAGEPPAAPAVADAAAPTPPAPREITLEEWIAAGQSCCGADRDGD